MKRLFWRIADERRLLNTDPGFAVWKVQRSHKRKYMLRCCIKMLNRLVFITLGCLLLTGTVNALLLKTTWGERVDLSERIVRGEVVEVKSHWNPERTRIFTDVTILVDEYLKGDGPRRLTVTIPGGTVGDMTEWVSDTPQFDVGEYGVILLGSSGQVTGGPDGVYLLKGEGGDSFLLWLRAYIAGDPKACKEGPQVEPKLQPK